MHLINLTIDLAIGASSLLECIRSTFVATFNISPVARPSLPSELTIRLEPSLVSNTLPFDSTGRSSLEFVFSFKFIGAVVLITRVEDPARLIVNDSFGLSCFGRFVFSPFIPLDSIAFVSFFESSL